MKEDGRRVVVVGGGISGLTAAWSAWEALSRHGTPSPTDVVLLEAEPDVGGKAQSLARDGWLVEAGPTGYLDNEPVMDRLVAWAGLEKLPADAAAARRFIVRGGRAREIQPHPLKFARSGILSPLGLLRIAGEPFLPRRTDPSDESIWEFARRRLGRQAADRLIAPMVLGVFAGDAKRLSLASSFPRMHELETRYGSLVRAMIRIKREKGKAAGGPAGPSGALTSFAHGLRELPLALGARAPFTVRTEARVTGLAGPGGGAPWRVTVAGDREPLLARAVVLACEAKIAAGLVRDAAPRIAAAIEPLYYPPVIVVALGFGSETLRRVPRGFGALIPRPEGFRILGVLWDTHLFPGRSPTGRLLMRTMLGGATDPEVAQLEDAELVRAVRADLKRLLGVDEIPVFREIIRWPRAIPQYELGHGARVREVESAVAELGTRQPGLHFAGNFLFGIAFAKAAQAGATAGTRAGEELAAGGLGTGG